MADVSQSVFRRFRFWLDELAKAGKTDPPPYSDPARQTAWRSGYEDALRDLASRPALWKRSGGSSDAR